VTDVLILRGDDGRGAEHRQQSRRTIHRARLRRLVARAPRAMTNPRNLHRACGLRSRRHHYLKTARQGLGHRASPARGRQSAIGGRRFSGGGARSDAARAPRRPRPSPGKTVIAHGPSSSSPVRKTGRLDEHQVCAFRPKRPSSTRPMRRIRGPRQCADRGGRDHDGGIPLRGRADPGQGVGGWSWSTVKAIINMRDDLSGMGPAPDLEGLPAKPTNGCETLDRPAGAAPFPPHAADGWGRRA